MVNIKVAGAGAGKTTSMSNSIIESYNNSLPHRNIYCIAFTNNASDNIKEKIKSKFGCIPNRIKISTIHSFLYQNIMIHQLLRKQGKLFKVHFFNTAKKYLLMKRKISIMMFLKY